MQRKGLLLGTLVSMLAATAPAQVQDWDGIKGLKLRLGAFLPASTEGRDIADVMLAIGFEYKISELTLGTRRPDLTLSLDYVDRDGFRLLPLLVNLVETSGRWYYTAGIGINFSRYPAIFGRPSDGNSRFGFQLGAGYNATLGNVPVFGEVKFLGTDESRFNGFGIYGGVRF